MVSVNRSHRSSLHFSAEDKIQKARMSVNNWIFDSTKKCKTAFMKYGTGKQQHSFILSSAIRTVLFAVLGPESYDNTAASVPLGVWVGKDSAFR